MFYAYNGILFDIINTNVHSMEAVYSDDGADYLYTRYHVDVTATLNPSAMSYPTGGIAPASTLVAIRNNLLQPRGTLIITDSGVIVMQCPENGYPCDAANGPFPRRCEITKFNGGRTWLMRWVCDFAVIECPLASSSSGIISNRYTQSHVINQHQLTTRTTIGTMRFRSDVLQQAGVFAHELFSNPDVQGAGLPDSLPGFQRESLDINVSSDGLTLHYRVRDVEKMYDKGEDGAQRGGSGIIRLEGSAGIMSISSKEGIAAGNSLAQVDIRAYGNKYSDQWVMMQRCFQIVIAKMGLNPSDPPIGYIVNAALRESMGEDDKWVDVSITFMQFPVGSTAVDGPGSIRLDPMMSDVFDVMTNVFGDQAGRNPSLPNADGTRGTADVTAMTAALKASCQNAAKAQFGSLSGGLFDPLDFNSLVPAINVTQSSSGSGREAIYQDTKYNPATQNQPTPYTHYRGSIEYEVHNNNLILATTAPPPDSNGSSSSGSQGGPASGPGSNQWTWPSSIVQLGSPIGIMRVEFQAERIGRPPAIPTLKPNDPDQNLILRMYRIRPEMPEVWVDGSTLIYTVNGFYEFYMKQVPQDGSVIAMGVLPWTQLTFEDQGLRMTDDTGGDIGDMVHGIYDPK